MADRPILNHAELVYRPGDREAAQAFFETMGYEVVERPGFPWLSIIVDPQSDPGRRVDGLMYICESTPAQQNLEAALDALTAENPDLADKFQRYRRIRRAHPQYVFHFGGSVPTHEDWQARVDRLREANESHPLLKGRLEIDVREPGDPTALGGLSQAFIHTDIVQVGVIQGGGILFDLQWAPSMEVLIETFPKEFPDRLAMV